MIQIDNAEKEENFNSETAFITLASRYAFGEFGEVDLLINVAVIDKRCRAQPSVGSTTPRHSDLAHVGKVAEQPFTHCLC